MPLPLPLRRHTYSYPTISVQVVAKGTVSIATVQGLVTPQAAAHVIQDSLGWPGPARIVNVVDYRRAMLVINLDQLLAAGRQVGCLHGRHVAPTALVAAPDQHLLLAAYCQRAMAHGILKAVFCSLPDALHWAQQEARVRARWLAQRT